MPTFRFILCSVVIVVAIWAMGAASFASRPDEPQASSDAPVRVRVLIDVATSGATPEVRQAALAALEREFRITAIDISSGND